jgi:hypothetical protein
MLVAVALALVLAAPAAAAPLVGSSDDPADGAGSAARDIEQVRASFDGETGRWTLTLRMRAPVSAAEDVRIHGILYREAPRRPGVCPSDDVIAELGRLQANTEPERTDQFFNAFGSTGATRALKEISPDGREVTLDVTAPDLVGQVAICASASVSKGMPYDTLNTPVILQPGVTPPLPSGPDTEEPAPDAPVVALASASRTFAVGRRHHRFTVRLKPFTAVTTLRLRVTRLSGGGSALARGHHDVAAGRTGAPRLTLTRAGRALLARAGRARVRLHVTAVQKGAPMTVRSFAVIIKRR